MQQDGILGKLRAFGSDPQGAVGTLIALMLPLLIGFAGLAIDIGHMYAVKAQMKNAADAGALAGARGLAPYVGINPPQPNWANGTQKAQAAVASNYVDKDHLAISIASPGADVPPVSGGPLISQATPCYYNLDTGALKPANATALAGDVAAIHVRISKTTGQNGGPLKMGLASLLGLLQADVSVTSVAVITFPSGMKAGGLKPMVATRQFLDKYWDQTGDVIFKIGEESKDPSINDTMWSTFKVDSDSDAYTKQLIQNGNPTPIYVGDSIYLQPGVRAVDYGPNEMGQFINTTVVLPIVDPSTLVAKTMAPTLGFIAFHITGYSQGGQYVSGYFDKNYVITNPQGVGTPSTSVPSTPNAPQLVY